MQLTTVWFGNTTTGIDGGIAKWLHEETIDITSTGANLRTERIDIMDFFMTTYKFRACFVFRNPGWYEKWSNEIFKPLSKDSWAATTAALIVTCASLKFVAFLENRIFTSIDTESWSGLLLSILSIITQQGAFDCPNQIAGRIIFINLCILSIILYNFYTSSIVSILLNKSPDMIETLDQLAASKMDMAAENSPYFVTYVQLADEHTTITLNKTNIYRNEHEFNFYPLEEGIEKVRHGHFAYHVLLSSAFPIIVKTFDQKELCDLTEIDFVPRGDVSFLAPKNSQYQELFQTRFELLILL